MMIRGISVALLATVIATGPGQANATSNADTPANLPPASYSDTQFVDNNGCVYVRAGLGGQVNWIPRVTRDRKQVCGMTPTFAVAAPKPVTTESASATKPKPKPAMAPTEATPVSVTAAPVAKSNPVPKKTASRKSLPKAAKKTAAARAPDPTHRIAGAVSLQCPDRSSIAVEYSGRSKVSVRCGAEAEPPKGSFRYVSVTPATAANTINGPVPANLAWTNESPPRLVDLNTRKVVTRKYPGLKYAEPTATTKARATASEAKAIPARTSTKASPAPKSAVTAPGHYVQVGTYGVPANASRTIARLQDLGLPVGTANLRNGSKTLKMVLAGPFTTGAQTQRALTTVRGAGFKDAFPRK